MTGSIITTMFISSRVEGPGAIPEAEMLEELLTLALWLGGGAFLISVLLPFVIKPLLARWGVIDIPSDRSSHDRPVIRGMGLAVAVAIGVMYTLALALGVVEVDRSVSLIVLAMMVASAALGWLEDYRGASVGTRLGVQLLIGALGTGALIVSLGIAVWWWPVGVIAPVAYINIANFMDGINGISGMHGTVVGLFYAWAGAANDMTWMMCAGLVVAGAFAGFLPWNLSRGTVFLGDVGSYVLGGSLVAIAIGAFLSGVYVEYLLPPLLIYFADTTVTLVKRVQRGEIWYKPHREHVYQRLTDVGLSHVQSSLVVTLATVLVSLISLWGLRADGAGSVLAGLATAAVVVLYLCLPRILRPLTRRGRRIVTPS
ncbi:glycosyltransferase family 4 protein [Kocuria sp. WRN011]|uniref:MraY family glycosyltransferase n=1 Tax=Kocuria sp. WRN011 TaxID=2029858 RepID=UPI0020B150D1|nr:glycosyltransferase family 4 protein [Kocuria sp. WRN011]